MWVDTLQSSDISYVNELMVLIVFLLQTIAEQNPRVVEHASGLAVLAVLNPKNNLWLQKCPDLRWTPDLWLHSNRCLQVDVKRLQTYSSGKRIQSGYTLVLFDGTSSFCKVVRLVDDFLFYILCWKLFIYVYLCLVSVCRFVLPGWVVEEGSKSERLQGAGKFGKANWPNNIQSIQSCSVKNFPNLTHENAHDPCSWATGRYDRNGGRMTTRTKFGGKCLGGLIAWPLGSVGDACMGGFSIAEHISKRSHRSDRSAMTPKMFLTLCYSKYCRYYIVSIESLFRWEGKYTLSRMNAYKRKNISKKYQHTTRLDAKYVLCVYVYKYIYIYILYIRIPTYTICQ